MAKTVGSPRKRIKRSQEVLDLVNRAKTLLAAAQSHRQTSRESAWTQSERQYSGKPFEGGTTNGDEVNVNMSFSTINTIAPYITGADPNFLVEPYSGDATPLNARLQQAMLNRQWRTNRMAGNSHLKRACWDYLVKGDGYLKVSYTMRQVFKAGTTVASDTADLWVDRLDPRDVWIDPAADGIHDARWVIVRFFKSVEELQKDDRYKNTGDLQGSNELPSKDSRESRASQAHSDHPRDQLVAVYEFYDIVANQMIVFCDQVEMPLQMVDDIDLPLVQLPNYPIPDSPYHMGELEQLIVLQRELDKTRTQMLEHRARNAQKWVARAGMIGQPAKDSLMSDVVNAVVEVEANDRQLSDIIAPLTSQPLLADVYAVDNIIKQDMYEISGANEYLRGAAPVTRRSATEATIMEGASNIKVAHKLHQIEQAVRGVGQLLLEYAAAIFPMTDADEMSMMLTGRDAQAVTAADPSLSADPNQVVAAKLTPSGDIFVGVYEVFVEQNSTELRNPVMRAQVAKERFTILLNSAPMLMQLGVAVNMRKALELWLDAEGVTDVDELIAQPDQAAAMPMMQQMQMQQQMAAAGVGASGGSQGLMPPQAAGAPNLGAAQPPTDMIGPGNSGMLPPPS
jgi:hypothetical protein